MEKPGSVYFVPALILCCLLPVLFIQINNFHDWGDDFAQYLLQAKWFSKQVSPMPVSLLNDYGPSLKGTLFSILLVPVTYSSLYELFYAKIIISLSLIALGCTLFYFLKKSVRTAPALVLTCYFVYNIHALQLKDQVLPDFLFITFILIANLSFDSGSKQKLWLTLLFMLLAVGCRSAGIVAIIAFVVVLLKSGNYFKINSDLNWRPILLLLAISLVYYSVETLISPEKNSFAWYLNLIQVNASFNNITNNIYQYCYGFSNFFEQDLPMWMNKFFVLLIFPSMVVQFLYNLLSKSGFREWVVVFYILLLLVYPYHHETSRFLVPLLVYGISYLAEFYNAVFNRISKKHAPFMLVGLSCLFLVSNFKATYNFTKTKLYYSPYNEQSVSLFRFIESTIPLNQKIAFYKPWALAYFTHHSTVPLNANMFADWIIISKNLPATEYCVLPPSATPLFENEEYVVFKK